MHEAQLARRLLDAVLERAKAARAARILTVSAWLSDPEGLSPESLVLHFASHARGTPADGARLDVTISRISALCRDCATVFETADHVPVCPGCGSLECTWETPPGLGIAEMEVV